MPTTDTELRQKKFKFYVATSIDCSAEKTVPTKLLRFWQYHVQYDARQVEFNIFLVYIFDAYIK